MSLRKAINAKCRECRHDPMDAGSAAQQIACCTFADCHLHSVRPITCKSIPARLLEHWHLRELNLCDRAWRLVETGPGTSGEGQYGPLRDASPQSNISPGGAA